MACIWTVDVDDPEVDVYVKYFDIALIPSTVFFWNAQHIKVDYGWCVLRSRCLEEFAQPAEPEFACIHMQHARSHQVRRCVPNKTGLHQPCGGKKDMASRRQRPRDSEPVCVPARSPLQVIYRGAMRGKVIVDSPIDPRNITKYELLYKGL
jgi:hypothetical protein